VTTNAAEDEASRGAGLLVPLFSCTSTRSWGIGDICDIPPFARWIASAGLRVLQLLPVNEMAPRQRSPYSAISAMAIDPIFIGVDQVEDFAALGGETALGPAERDVLARVRSAPAVDHPDVRSLKETALRQAFERFVRCEQGARTARWRDLERFVEREAWWLGAYAVFRAIHATEGERPWTEWPEGLRHRDPAAIEEARRELDGEVRFQQYLQWVADRQWRAARAAVPEVALYGDLPFMVDADSADVWSRPGDFRLDVSVGVPPDAFSATGQDWGMPTYRWDAMAPGGYAWLRERARRAADLYDGYRIDHLVGFYRTYGRPKDGSPAFFDPESEADQIAQGERLLELFRASGAAIIAEDLGTVPDAVRESLARLGIPGFKVLRWERHWHTEGQPFRDPREYPARSVAASGTHDTAPLAVWWEEAGDEERRQLNDLALVREWTRGTGLPAAFSPAVRDTLLELLFASGSRLALFPVQDVFGWHDRVNEPATVNDRNWSYRLPWPVDRWDDVPEARERRDALRGWAERHGRAA
jgi:4-alpha-glucanotransferase